MQYTPSLPFSAWAGPRSPRLLIVGEAWGRHEAELGRPFAGESGKELFTMLGEAMPEIEPELHARIRGLFRYGLAWTRQREDWLAAAGIAFTNAFNLQPYGNKISELCVKKADLPKDYDLPAIEGHDYLAPQYLPEIERLRQEILEARPNLVLCAGAKSSWALLRDIKISSIRGAITSSLLVPGQKVLPTYHPAAVLRQWSWRPIVVQDLIKAKREAQFAELRRPARKILYSPSLRELREWTETALASGAPLFAADTETRKGQITMVSIARTPEDAIVIPFVDERKPGWSYWPSAEDELAAWACVERLLCGAMPLCWQNGLYDLQYITPLGIPARGDEDTMLLHHSLWPEMQKGLGFLGSIYTSEPAWKLMRTVKADTEKRDE